MIFKNKITLCVGRDNGEIYDTPPANQGFYMIRKNTKWVLKKSEQMNDLNIYLISEYGNEIKISDKNASWFEIK